MNAIGQLTYPEISSQDQALSAAIEEVGKNHEWVRRYIGNSNFDEVIFIGSGSSYYQALVMASTYRTLLGRSAIAYPSSEIFLFRKQASLPQRNYLLVGVSRSGESTEVILALEAVKDLANWTTCGITCYEESKMAEICDCIVSPLGKEKSTVMTKSFSSMVFMMQYAIVVAAGNTDVISELEEVAALDKEIITVSDNAIKQFVALKHFKKVVFLGMGTYYGLSQEACLKIKEMACFWSESYGTLEFRHGPKAIVDNDTLVVLLVSEQARAYELKVAEEMKEYGAKILLLTAQKSSDTAFADLVIEVGGKHLDEESRSVLYMPALQYLGFYTALKQDLNPDEPRNLTQVVKL